MSAHGLAGRCDEVGKKVLPSAPTTPKYPRHAWTRAISRARRSVYPMAQSA